MDLNAGTALLMTLLAGLATGIGSAIAFFARKTNRRFLSFSLGLSAGVMIYVSFMELMFKANAEMGLLMESQRTGTLIVVAAFFGGILLSMLIDKLVPEPENPHELHSVEEMSTVHTHHEGRLKRMGIITALAVGIHNFPEGIATFMSALESPKLGLAIAVAIAIHNIPEGIAVSVPVYYATGSRRKAFWWSFLSGVSEPIGALAAYLLLMPFLTPTLLYCTFAVVAGIMVYISLDELLPAAHQYGENHVAIYGLVLGMAIMALSLIMLM